TEYLLQDLGWPVNHPLSRGLEDLDGRGWNEAAVLRVSDQPAGHRVVVLDPGTGTVLREIGLSDDVSAVDMAVLPSFGGTAASEIAVLTWRAVGGAIRVFVHDAMSGARLSSIGFPTGFPKAILMVPDFGGTSAPEILVFGTTPAGAIKVWIKDARSGALLANLTFPKYLPGAVAVVPSFGGTAAPEVAVAATDPATDDAHLLVKDGRSGADLGRHALPRLFTPNAATPVRSFGGGGADEVAVLGLELPVGIPELHVVDPESGALLRSRRFADSFEPRGLATVEDYAGTPADEVAILGIRTLNLANRILVVDTSSGAVLTAATLPSQDRSLALDAVADQAGSNAPDLLVVTSSPRDGVIRLFVKDARGAQLRSLVVE
ncbi:MAG: hypothetical protein R3190_06095, partial [Thermoanaerobaculia bacterium]|nr:hypothetical protein [Thermoanaerobaculia bacterium]